MTEATATITPRTQDEIAERVESRRPTDFLGFETSEYIDYLDFDHAKPYLKEDAAQGDWDTFRAGVVPPKDAMAKYMEFAFGKAHGERGISANRSISHMIAWAWVSGDDELLSLTEGEYSGYGLSILRGICEHLGIDPKEHGDY